MNDTPPEVEVLFREMMMARSPQERMRMAASMFETARALALSSLPPDASEWDKRRHLMRRFYGDEPALVEAVIARIDAEEAAAMNPSSK
jgi:hypothetical protein